MEYQKSCELWAEMRTAEEKKILVRDVGEVTFRRSRRARRVSIRISSDGKVQVTVPYRGSWEKAIRFLEEKKGWVLRTLQRISAHQPKAREYRPGRNRFTRHHDLVLRPARHHPSAILLKVGEGEATLDYPHQMHPTDPRLREAIREAYIHILRKEAREVLLPRLAELAARHGYHYRRAFLKNLRSRWGSCSTAGNINLNIHLMELPDHLIDYVLLHELAHTRHRNHGPAFWEELQRTTGRARELDRELSHYRIRLDP